MSKKHKRENVESEVQLASVVTPMLDMSFQLLFFLILGFKPSNIEEGKLEFNLPASGEAKARAPIDNPTPSDTELALPAQLTVHVRTVNDGINNGNISAILVKSTDGETSVPDLPRLEAYLKAKQGEVSNKEDIKIEADSKLKYTCVIDVMDACLRAGFKSVGFNPPPDLGSSN